MGYPFQSSWGFADSSVGKESACNAGGPGSIPGLERSAGKGKKHSSILAWATKSWTGLSNFHFFGFPISPDGRVCLQCRRPWFNPWVRKIPWRRKWQRTPVFLSGKSHGRRALAGYTTWGHKESDTTKQLTYTQALEHKLSSCGTQA